jgi:smad nuclear-interacting protein 1
LERRGPLPSQSDAFTDVAHPSDAPAPEKQKPNFNPTGRLAAESNTIQVQGGTEIVLKYHEPPEARKPPPKEAWRMYVFKGQDLLETVELSERSCWLVGRERMVVDFPLDHPSCSKQHAVLQFRFVEKRNEYGDRIGKVKPYLIDLESANGSSVNGETIPGGRYVEVMDKDVIRFGLSSREYVLMLPPS